jgi:hypothetical protein
MSEAFSSNLESSDIFEVPLHCPKCGQTGVACYERNAGSQGRKRTATSPFRTSDGFYLRVNVTPTFNMHIVCARCGKTHLGRLR